MSGHTYVMVTTSERGVYGGWLLENAAPARVVLGDARMCVYWPPETRGVVSLAEAGPGERARVSKAAPQLTLFEVTAIAECTDQARQRWEAAPWGR